jgi:hypothetical protein
MVDSWMLLADRVSSRSFSEVLSKASPIVVSTFVAVLAFVRPCKRPTSARCATLTVGPDTDLPFAGARATVGLTSSSLRISMTEPLFFVTTCFPFRLPAASLSPES